MMLTSPAGEVLVDQPLVLQPECTRSAGCGWQDWTTPFTPTTAAPYTLFVTVLTVETPAVHIRVADPQKTDGVRAPGF
ncbi:hypothetical protein BJF78_07440 [Pseudonocardia sp. CNS-139]|nr:hypothetical protein BJF78_07440 [Pseudonocardia sp. CNS-139]